MQSLGNRQRFLGSAVGIAIAKINAILVDSACADCPGFWVLGAAPAPASTFVSEPQIVPLG